jgi:hypothetical protein
MKSEALKYLTTLTVLEEVDNVVWICQLKHSNTKLSLKLRVSKSCFIKFKCEIHVNAMNSTNEDGDGMEVK